MQNWAPAQQESVPPKSGDEAMFLQALNAAPIAKVPIDQVKEALRYAMVKIGLRSQNWPQDEEKALLLAHIVREYGNHTVEEIRLAFDMAIAGKLELLPGESVNCYENFSCLYFSSIMNAYRRWAAQTHRQVKPALPEATPGEEMTDEAMEEWVNQTRKMRLSVELLPVLMYDWLLKKGRISTSVEQKKEYLMRAVAYRQGKLIKALDEHMTVENRQALKEFLEMKEEGVFSGAEATILKSLAKKMILFDYLKNLDNHG